MPTMKSVQTAAPGTVQVGEIECPVPGPRDVLVRVCACGTDAAFVQMGGMPVGPEGRTTAIPLPTDVSAETSHAIAHGVSAGLSGAVTRWLVPLRLSRACRSTRFRCLPCLLTSQTARTPPANPLTKPGLHHSAFPGLHGRAMASQSRFPSVRPRNGVGFGERSAGSGAWPGVVESGRGRPSRSATKLRRYTRPLASRRIRAGRRVYK
jgi:hypothetical protein